MSRARKSAEPPKKIGRYEVARLLGQGGMGRVWLARDSVLGRRVAIKILRDDLALPPTVKDELIVRMGHEARAAAAVSHPNIVTLHDMGEDDAVGLFLVFEYVTARYDVDGAETEAALTLRDRLKRGPLSLPEVAKLARDLGSGLTFAHEAGVVHRDVKPENILFSRTGFKIADFGIARIPDSTITRANTVLGTPAYTAPEALSKGDFGPASDQFSLGATLYEAATGMRAFGGDDAIATAGSVSNEPPPPMSATIASEETLRALEAVLHRGVAKTPEARYVSCAELGEEVARALEGARGASVRVPLEVERSPLSSRSLVQKTLSEQLLTDPLARPSLIARKQTHRFQNIAAGIALVVILVLVVLGRRTPAAPPPVAEPEPVTSASVAPTTAAVVPPPSAKPRPHPTHAAPPRPAAPSSLPVEDAAAPATSATAEPVERDE